MLQNNPRLNRPSLIRLPKLRSETSAALAGVVGGSLSTMMLHPFDVLKTRQAVYGGSIWHHTPSRQALLQGLYRGVGANILVAASSWGVYFTTFDVLKKAIGCQTKTNGTVLAALGAGSVCNLITNPLSVVRARMLLSDKTSTGKGSYDTLGQTLVHIAKTEGISGFYKGLLPSLCNISHGTIQFVLYEEMKANFSHRKPGEKITPMESLSYCIASKLIATMITYPCQNLRARKQAGELATNVNSPTTIKGVIRKEGLFGLYRGLAPTLVHVTPNVCLVFLVYEFFVG